MSYHDPYATQYEQGLQGSSGQHQYNADFNPYPTNPHEHNGYQDASNYRDDVMSYPPKQQGTDFQSAEPNRRGGFEHGEFAGQEKSVRGLKQYRHNYRGNLWTKGGTGRCIGRFCCCTIMSVVLLVVSIVLALALWIEPPNIVVGAVTLSSSNPLQVNTAQEELTINFGVNISVNNPNYFGVAFQNINADIFYPINNTRIGGGQLSNVVFKPNQQTNVTFPLAIDYKASADPNYAILTDLAQKCGLSGGSQSQISVTYQLTLGLRVLLFVVSPTVSNPVSFGCPADVSQLESFLKSLGITL